MSLLPFSIYLISIYTVFSTWFKSQNLLNITGHLVKLNVQNRIFIEPSGKLPGNLGWKTPIYIIKPLWLLLFINCSVNSKDLKSIISFLCILLSLIQQVNFWPFKFRKYRSTSNTRYLYILSFIQIRLSINKSCFKSTLVFCYNPNSVKKKKMDRKTRETCISRFYASNNA